MHRASRIGSPTAPLPLHSVLRRLPGPSARGEKEGGQRSTGRSTQDPSVHAGRNTMRPARANPQKNQSIDARAPGCSPRPRPGPRPRSDLNWFAPEALTTSATQRHTHRRKGRRGQAKPKPSPKPKPKREPEPESRGKQLWPQKPTVLTTLSGV
ncbi:hypothetical protein Mp_2g17990 [Marchantia polymorpha subsp. ruderalis]|uniref:Uncharacterized protein n=1 Tax=Marchantia polymorpha TaxID=3197 RepID=A0A2R6WGB7_MARPO|nr:hypothetical protein MARPO_0094s0067 [Marchantia polymorpha]BBN02770.1 hypothetical protein Mp_2g17990 [Marchantia polymorpha subsp. ruderalis]|eukprot:PTQ32898.1 hypothetical protein MARPO_0094s0067 [Marchantia polymorpha]